MRSIRVFLATSIVALLILFNFVAAVQGYQSSMREADALFDNQMLDLARLVSNLDVSNDRLHSLQLGDDLAFQIWQNATLLAASSNAPPDALHDFIPGFSYANFDSYRWRTLAQFDQVQSKWVVTAVCARRKCCAAVSRPSATGYPTGGVVGMGFRKQRLGTIAKAFASPQGEACKRF